MQTYINALVYELTNAKDEPQTFRCELPKHLSQYCKEFAAPHTIIKHGPPVLICKGVGGVCHEFLVASGYSTCSKCNHIMCSYCQGSSGMDMSMFCLLCDATESLIPELDSPAAESIENKRRILIEICDFSGADELDSDEVEDVLDLMRFMKSFKDMECTVPFPLYPSDAMFGNDMLKWNR